MKTTEAAEALTNALTPPVQMIYYGNVHVFAVAPTPRTYNGVRVRVIGLPLTCEVSHLHEIAAVFAKESDILHCELLHTRGGTQIDRGIIIFRTCPADLLHLSVLQAGPFRLQFSFLNDVTCNTCKHRGHSDSQCPYRPIPPLSSKCATRTTFAFHPLQ